MVPPGPGWPILGHPMAPPGHPGIFDRELSCARKESPVFSLLLRPVSLLGVPVVRAVYFRGPSPSPSSVKRAGSDLRRGSLAGVLLSVRTAPQIRPAPAPKAHTISLSGRILPHGFPTPSGHFHIRSAAPNLAESIPSHNRQSGARSRAPGCRFCLSLTASKPRIFCQKIRALSPMGTCVPVVSENGTNICHFTHSNSMPWAVYLWGMA